MSVDPAPLIVDGLVVADWRDPQVYASALRGGLAAFNATCAVWEGTAAAIGNIAEWYARIDADPRLRLVRGTDDILDSHRTGRLGVILGFQNASPIEDDLRYLAIFKVLGVGIVQLTYNSKNLLGCGCYENVDHGLTEFGRRAVREMNRLGIAIDLSHVGERTALDVLDWSQVAPTASHVVPARIFQHRRNKSDELLAGLAEAGGMIGVCAYPAFLPRGAASTIEDYIDVIEATIEAFGGDHVGIGTDHTQGHGAAFFEWIARDDGTGPFITSPDPVEPLSGLRTLDGMPSVVASMCRRGWSAEQVSAVMGGNWVRYLRTAWHEETRSKEGH